MRYMIERNWVEIIGPIWWPSGAICAQRIELSGHDLENIGEFTRDNVEEWLCTHSGDFQHVQDFYATAGDIEIPWDDEESEFTYQDCMYPAED